MITGTYKAELTIDFHLDEADIPDMRDFGEIQKDLADGELNNQILELIRSNFDFDEQYIAITLTQKSAEIRRKSDETD